MSDFLNFIASVLRVSANSIDLDTAYGSIPQWTSIMHLRLVMEIEEKYGVDIPIDEIAAIQTIGGFLKYVSKEVPQ